MINLTSTYKVVNQADRQPDLLVQLITGKINFYYKQETF